MRIILHTNLTADEALDRLKNSVDKSYKFVDYFQFVIPFMQGKCKEVIGWFKGQSFRLLKRKWYRNSFAPVFYGKIIAESDRDGSRIEGRFSMDRFAKIFITIWFGSIFLMILTSILNGNDSNKYTSALILSLFAVFGFALTSIGKWIGRHEEEFIIDFLKQTIDAHTIEKQD